MTWKKYEQESFQYKRLIDTMRNEYESKINELTEDMSFMKKQLKQKDAELVQSSRKLVTTNESADVIQELTENNQKLKNQLKVVSVPPSPHPRQKKLKLLILKCEFTN